MLRTPSHAQWLLRSTSLIALVTGAIAAPALAQSQTAQTPAQSAQAPAVEEIVVTGTRIVRNGYEAPTPVTVVGVEAIQAMAPPNIADLINTLPAFAGGATSHQPSQGLAGANDGLSNLNLRGLGVQRGLVLLDGQRVVTSALNGAVDTNTFPNGLISRVDVVTGGASAAYGSDAVAGVVNFVLDKTFTGLKGEVGGGVSTYGDDGSYKINLTGGFGFAGDRGHFLINGELNHVGGIWGQDAYAKRPYLLGGNQVISNPLYAAGNGQPQMIVASQVGQVNATPGGIIVSGPLKGIYFGEGGQPAQFDYGPLFNTSSCVGCSDWRYVNFQNTSALDQRVTNNNVFTRVSYDVTDNFNVFLQASYAISSERGQCCYQFNLGNITIKADNAFIPASVAAQVQALKLTSLTMGSMDYDLGIQTYTSRRQLKRYVAGANGKFDAFDTNWTWNAYYQKGVSLPSYALPVNTNITNWNLAIDAVRAPNGSIVCRSTLTNPTNGCVPFDVFGTNVNSQAAKTYSETGPNQDILDQRFMQDVQSVTFNGEPFSDWAGPISLAFGAEHRREAVKSYSDAASKTFSFFSGNYQESFGHYEVTEGFGEVAVPLAKDTVWAKQLDLNAAVRATGYSTSGYVTTWKLGGTYSPIDDIRFRATRSRDIRAPNLGEAFQAGVGNVNSIINDFQNFATQVYRSEQIGNPNLLPEKANTTDAGFVLQPRFFPGFNASFDYYDIRINGAIGTLSPQQFVDGCYSGNKALCAEITFNPDGSIAQIVREALNYLTYITRGYDIEASYTTRLDNIVPSWNGTVSMRALGTHFLTDRTNDGLGNILDTAGQDTGSGPPRWRWNLQAIYANDPFAVTVTGRAISGGVYNNSYVLCASGCPASSTAHPTINYNHIDGIFYTDLAMDYKFMSKAAGSNVDSDFYIAISNLFNLAPPLIASGPSLSYTAPSTNFLFYDAIGRQFRAGIRFKM